MLILAVAVRVALIVTFAWSMVVCLSYIRVVVFFFFSSRRRHTRCSRDWSSDVCSSDLQLHERTQLLCSHHWFGREVQDACRADPHRFWIPAQSSVVCYSDPVPERRRELDRKSVV